MPMYSELAKRLVDEGVEATLARHRAPTTTTCVIAVAANNLTTTVVDDLTLDQRHDVLLDLGADVYNPHSPTWWVIAFLDANGNLRVLGHGKRLKAQVRAQFHSLMAGPADELESLWENS